MNKRITIIATLIILRSLQSKAQESIFDHDTVAFAMVKTNGYGHDAISHREGCHEIYDCTLRKNIASCDTIKNVQLIYRNNGVVSYFFRTRIDFVNFNYANDYVFGSHPLLTKQDGNTTLYFEGFPPFIAKIVNNKIIYTFSDVKNSSRFYKVRKSYTEGSLLKNRKIKLPVTKPFLSSHLENINDRIYITYKKDTVIAYKQKKIPCYVYYATCETSSEDFTERYVFFVEKKSLVPIQTFYEEYDTHIDYPNTSNKQHRKNELICKYKIFPVVPDVP